MPGARLLTEGETDELRSLVGMPDQPRRRPATRERHLQSVGDQFGAHVIGHGPAHDPAAGEVLDGDEVPPALPGSEVGDVSDPQPVRRGGQKRAVDEVLADPDAGNTDRRSAALGGPQAGDRGLTHEALDALCPTRSPSAMASSAWMRGDP